MSGRQRLTPLERSAIYERQGGKCICCGDPLTDGLVEEEHTIALCLGGDPKPDALMLKRCHRPKTRADLARLAKLRRLAGKTRCQWHGTHRGKGELKSRAGGWPKRPMSDLRFRRKFDGSVVRRQ